jgi:DNA-binding LacI/PurR family transcriptional regulator
MLEIPKRANLASLVADAMRKAIDEGTWRECLPGERRLCALFQVSRPTLRTALRQLAAQGLFEIRQGRVNRLFSRPRIIKKRSRLVILVTTEPISHVSSAAYQGISDMRVHLAEQGFETEILICSAPGAVTPRSKIESFLRHNSVFCCVLLSVSREMQQWFAKQSVPSLVLGHCHATVRLPSLDVDYRSVCRHAAGVFLGKGHRNLALIVPNSGVAGYIASEEGFLQAVAQSQHREKAHAVVLKHSGTPRSLMGHLDVLFNSPRPPTALLVAKQQYVIFVMAYLLKRGITVPGSVSLIARDYDHLFEPLITHYAFNGNAYAQRLSRLMHQMVRDGNLSPEPTLIFPRFVQGGTLRAID